MTTLDNKSLQQLFTEARSHNAWLPESVSDDLLHQLYELVKWGPTSANTCPLRIYFVKSPEAKKKLAASVAEFNVAKIMAAPVTAILAMDARFYEKVPQLFPHAPEFKDMFVNDTALSETTAFRNSSLQGAYFIMAARALGLDCGPMSGFNNKALDEAFFSTNNWKSNFICNIGFGDHSKLFPRLPRLSFEEACLID